MKKNSYLYVPGCHFIVESLKNILSLLMELASSLTPPWLEWGLWTTYPWQTAVIALYGYIPETLELQQELAALQSAVHCWQAGWVGFTLVSTWTALGTTGYKTTRGASLHPAEVGLLRLWQHKVPCPAPRTGNMTKSQKQTFWTLGRKIKLDFKYFSFFALFFFFFYMSYKIIHFYNYLMWIQFWNLTK